MMKELSSKKAGDTVHLRGHIGTIYVAKDMLIESVGRLYITLYDGTRYCRKTGLAAQSKSRARFVAPNALRVWPSAEAFSDSLVIIAEINRIANDMKDHAHQLSSMLTVDDCANLRKKLGLPKQDLSKIRKAMTR